MKAGEGVRDDQLLGPVVIQSTEGYYAGTVRAIPQFVPSVEDALALEMSHARRLLTLLGRRGFAGLRLIAL